MVNISGENFDRSKTLAADATGPVKEACQDNEDEAHMLITMAISKTQIDLVTSCDTAADPWKAFSGHFEHHTRQNFILLMRKLFKLEMAEGGSLENRLHELKDITDRLAVNGEAVKEKYQVAALLASLPRSNTAVSKLSANDSAILSFTQKSLLNEDVRRTSRDEFQSGAQGMHHYSGNSET